MTCNNHATGRHVNCRDGAELRDIAVGEEILEDYGHFDKHEPWYARLPRHW